MKDEYSDLAALKERISALEPCCRGCIQGVNYGPREIFAVDVRWLEDCADKAKGDTTTFFNAGGAERITDLLVRAIERAQDHCLEVFICWRYLNPGASGGDSAKKPIIEALTTRPKNRKCCGKKGRKRRYY